MFRLVGVAPDQDILQLFLVGHVAVGEPIEWRARGHCASAAIDTNALQRVGPGMLCTSTGMCVSVRVAGSCSVRVGLGR